MFLCFHVLKFTKKLHVFMYFIHLVLPFTLHYFKMVKGLSPIVYFQKAVNERSNFSMDFLFR